MRYKTQDFSKAELPYIKSLDGIRAIAAIMVVFFHSPIHMFQFEFGWAGVNLFFILSGFLITRILINSKQQPLKIYLKNFYIRRTLRIFPLYFFYLLLASAVLLLLNGILAGEDEMIREGIDDFKRNYPFLITYTYNFEGIINFLAGRNYHNSMFTGHLWSLSVEIQFYLLFPFVIYYLPEKTLKRLLLFIVFLIPLLRLIFVLVLKEKVHDFLWIGEMLYMSTIFQLDALCLGACLVLFDISSIVKRAPLYLTGLIIVMLITGVIHLLKSHGIPLSSFGYDIPVYHLSKAPANGLLDNRYFYSIPMINAAFGLLMVLVIHKGFWNKFFENSLIVYVGKISYGIYIYHLGLSYIFTVVITNFLPGDIGDYSFFYQGLFVIIYLSILFYLSYLSFIFFEMKFLKLKGKFTYHSQWFK